jgi:YydF family exported signaling peptide
LGYISREGGDNMKKENTNNEPVKNLEFKGLLDESQKLAKVNDLWYFVKSKENRWILGSGH